MDVVGRHARFDRSIAYSEAALIAVLRSEVSYLAWLTVAGALLLTMALSSAYIKRLPISTSIIYLAAGVALGPLGFDAVRLDVREQVSTWFERLTEGAVIVSLFVSGAKLRLPLRSPDWRAPLRLAGPLMLWTIAGVAAFCHFAFDLPWGAALLVGAMLAPTDPVLASAIAIENASDRDRMRYGLSGEAGLNDGLAFPFVVLALLWLERDGPGSWLGGWAAHRLLWAVPVGLFVGYVLGRLLGHLAVYIRSRERDTAAPSDFLALALIALAYVSAEAVSAWGFLSVFAAGMGLRRAERKIVQESPHTATPPERGAAMKSDESDPARAAVESHPPAENLIPKASSGALEQPAVAAGTLLSEVLSFGDTTERLLEVALVLIVGISLAQHWDPRAFALAFVLMVLIRPMGAHLVLLGTPTTSAQRWLMAGSAFAESAASTTSPTRCARVCRRTSVNSSPRSRFRSWPSASSPTASPASPCSRATNARSRVRVTASVFGRWCPRARRA